MAWISVSGYSFSSPFLSGIFFVLPCIESYQKVDLRTITLGVPPQEVSDSEKPGLHFAQPHAGAHQGLCHGVRGRSGLLQGVRPYQSSYWNYGLQRGNAFSLNVLNYNDLIKWK